LSLGSDESRETITTGEANEFREKCAVITSDTPQFLNQVAMPHDV
jgi:hypothetical protein